MYMKKYFSESVMAFILLVLLICFVNPFGWWMPTSVHMVLLGMMIAAFSLFSLLVWRERYVDEREVFHGMLAARFAYLAGALVLVLGITIEAFQHNINPWLPLSLGVMVIAKMATRVWAEKCH